MSKNFIYAIIVVIALIVIIIAIASYESVPTIEPPAGFIVLENPSQYDFEAWSPDNIKIGIKKQVNENEASLDFWVEHIKNVMLRLKRYDFKEVRDFKTRFNEKSKCLIFEKTEQKVRYTYLAGITSDSSYVYVIEAAGEKEIVEPKLAQLLKSFETLK